MINILFDAINKENKEICKILIEKIKEKDPVDPWASDITALQTAVSSRNLEICKILIKHADNPNPADDIYADTALHDAAVNGDIDIFKLIMEHSGESNPSNRRGQTALHHAVRDGNLEICKFIVQNAGNINEPDHNNQTPLHYAFECEEEGMLIFKFKFSPLDVNPLVTIQKLCGQQGVGKWSKICHFCPRLVHKKCTRR